MPSELLLRMTVEIGDGRVGEVLVHPGDTAASLAAHFCARHALAPRAEALLTQHIQTNIDELKAPAPAAAPATAPVRAARPDAELSPSTEQALAALDALEGEDGPAEPAMEEAAKAWMAATDVPVRRARSPKRSMSPALDVAKRPGGPQMSPRRGNNSPTQPERAAAYAATRGARARSAPREGQPVISRRSRDLASLRPRDGVSIFERLHGEHSELMERRASRQEEKEALERSSIASGGLSARSSASERYARRSRAGGGGDVFERLFQEGEFSKQNRLRAQAEAQADRDRDDPDLTFQPTLSTTSRSLASQRAAATRAPGRPSDDVFERHHREATRRAQAQTQLSRLYARQEDRETTFHPTISSRSAKLARARSAPPRARGKERTEAPRGGAPIHDALFGDAAAKRRRQQAIDLQKKAEEDAAAAAHSLKAVAPAVIERHSRYREKKEEELAILRRYLQRPMDPVTGQLLYKPKITRGPAEVDHLPHKQPQHRGKHAGTALHDAAREIARPRAELELAEQRKMEGMRKHVAGRFAKGESDRLVKRLRQERLRELFASLDTEGDGVIDADRAQERLPADLAAAIAPHLAGFSGDFLAFSDFEALVDEALKAPSAGPRALLLPRRERWEEAAAKSPTYSFKPTLDAKSEALAATTRPKAPVHELLMEAKSKYRERQEAAQGEAEEARQQELTFKPTITAKGRRSLGGSARESARQQAAEMGAEERARREARELTFEPTITAKGRKSVGRAAHAEPKAGVELPRELDVKGAFTAP